MLKGKRRDVEDENRCVDLQCYGLIKKDAAGGGGFIGSCGPPSAKKIRVRVSDFDEGADEEPQDADYSNFASLDYEVESLIWARFPRSKYWKLCLLNKRCLSLLRSGEIFKIRREIGVAEASVFMLASGETSWWAFHGGFKSCMRLPIVPSDVCFHSGDKESFCAGTHLLVSGKEIDGIVVWRYELGINKWFKGPNMISPRCLFASTTCGAASFVAGGVGADASSKVYNTAEKYSSETGSWESLPRMKRRRKLCSGCFMDNRFYVIGGRNEDGELTCGEYFDQAKNQWELIPDMFKDDPVLTCHSPPLIAVANNELYSLEASTNLLKVYMKKSNTWKALGPAPVRADFNRGWGVGFKTLGSELLVIGASSSHSYSGNCMSIYTCRPDPHASGDQPWKVLESGRNRLSDFILNCSIMSA